MKRDYNSDSFFQLTRTDQNSSTKFYKISRYPGNVWPKVLNYENCSFFQRNIQYRTRRKGPFLVGAKRKEPDYYSHSFFFKDRLEATNVNVQYLQLNEYPGNASKLFQSVPPLVFYFLFTFSRKPTKPEVPKESLLWIFSGTVRLFLENFLLSPKGPPSRFLIFCNGMYVNKSRRVPLLHFSALCDFF